MDNIKLTEDVRIPGTDIILEKGDVIEVLEEGAQQLDLAKEMLKKFIDEKKSMAPADLSKLLKMI